MGQQAPRAPTSQHVEDRVHDLALLHELPPALLRRLRNQGLQQLPLPVVEIVGIGLPPYRCSHTLHSPFIIFYWFFGSLLSLFYRPSDGIQTHSKMPASNTEINQMFCPD